MKNILEELKSAQNQATRHISSLRDELKSAKAKVTSIERSIKDVDGAYMKRHYFAGEEIQKGNSTTGNFFYDYALVSVPATSVSGIGEVETTAEIVSLLHTKVQRAIGEMVLLYTWYPGCVYSHRFCVGVIGDNLRLDLAQKECWIDVGERCITIAFGIEDRHGFAIPSYESPQLHHSDVIIGGLNKMKGKGKSVPRELVYFASLLLLARKGLTYKTVTVGNTAVWEMLNSFLQSHASKDCEKIGRQIASNLGVEYQLPRKQQVVTS